MNKLKFDPLASRKGKILLADQIRADALTQKAQAELPQFTGDPLSLVVSGRLQIKTKAGMQIPLVLNQAQRRVIDRIRTIQETGQPVRLWILKARQMGVSTLTEAMLYSLTSLQSNRNTLIMADEDDKASYLHDICKFYHDYMLIQHPSIAPKIKKSNAKKLEFEDLHSQILIEPAKNVGATRAFVYQYCHLSEAGFYRYLADILQALQGVPDHPDTMIIGESTANGEGTEFHKEWLSAKSGKTGWSALFLPWFLMEEYSRPLPAYPIDQIIHDRSGGSLDAFLKEEALLKKRFNLADEQLNWRRWAIVNKLERQVRKFRVEYPSDDEEAFQTSGERFFPTEFTQDQAIKPPIRVGYMVPGPDGPEIRDHLDGPIRIYHLPEQGDLHVIAVDPSEGIGRDEAAAVVRNQRMNRNDVELYGNLSPDELAVQVHLLLQRYPGLIVPERNGIGVSLISALLKFTGSIFKERVTEQGSESTERYGWFMDSVSWPLAYDQLGNDLRDKSIQLIGEASIREIRQLVKSSSGKPEAPRGGQDGLAVCNAIASYVRALRPPGLARPSFSHLPTSASTPAPNMGRGFSRK